MFNQRDIHTNWAVWLQWILLTSSSKLVTVIALNKLLPPNLDTLLSSTAFYAVWALSLFFLGTVVAATQWLILRDYFSGAARWMVASGIGMAVGGIMPFPLKLRDLYLGPSGFQLDEIAYGVVFGFLIGVAQWLVMRTWVQGAGWWVLGSTIGWALGTAVGEILPLNWNSLNTGQVYAIITEGIPMAVTGFTLVMLLQNPLHPKSIMDKRAG